MSELNKKGKSEILLESFNKNELKAFNTFINYSLSGKSRSVLDLWNTIYNTDSNNTEFNLMYKYPRKALSDFNKQIEKFLIFKGIENEDFNPSVYLTRELRKRNIEKYFEQILQEIENVKQERLGKGFQNTLDLLKLNFEEYFLYAGRHDRLNLYKNAKERMRLTEYITIHSKLTEYFNAVYYSNEKKFTDCGLIKINDVIENLEKNKSYYIKYHPNLWTLYLIYFAIENSDDFSRIQVLAKYIRNNENKFTQEFLQFSYDALLRIIFTQVNAGSNLAFEEFYKIVLSIESRGILDRIQHIQPRLFVGIVIVCVNSNNIKLAEKIINKYSNKLSLLLRNQISKIAISVVELSKGNYQEVKRLLSNEKPKDSMLNIFCKTTLIKSYYESKDFRYIYPLSDSLKHFLKRRSDTAELYESVSKFLAYTSKLAKVRRNNCAGLEFIEYDIMNENYFFQKKWVVKQIEIIKHKKSMNNC